jgi:hypothetical protein
LSAGAPVRAWQRRALGGAIAAAVFTCFAPAVGYDFVLWDDDMNISENAHYRGFSPAHLRWMFTTSYGGHYQPLTWVSFAVDHALWGMSPAGYHLTNLLLHAANAVLVYLLCAAFLRSTPVPGEPQRALYAAAAGALFFALHPLRVESVVWVTARRDVLSGFFYLLTVLTYLRMVDAERDGGPRVRWLAVSVGCFSLSLLAKAWGLMLPFALLVLDIFPLRRRRSVHSLLFEKVPYGIAAIGALLLTARMLTEFTNVRTLAEHGVLERALQAAYGLCFYVWKTVAPLRLSPLYLLDPKLDPREPRFLIAAAAVVLAAGAMLVFRRRWPWLLAASVCYAIVVAPLLGLWQTGPQLVADRYTYLACLPWGVLAAAAVWRLGPGWASVGGTATVLVLLGVLTVRQTAVWRDSRALWDHALRIDPRNWVAYTNRGFLRDLGGDRPGAVADYSAAIAAHPGYALAWFNRGTARQASGDVQGAIADLNLAIRFNPRDARAWNNRGWARETLGDMRGALADYEAALRAAPPDFPGRAQIEENIAAARAFVGSAR